MAMTRQQWAQLQRNLPPSDRQSYEEYLASLAGTTPTTPTTDTTTPPATTPTTPPATTPTEDDGEWVVNWRNGFRARRGTPLGDLYEKQNAEREQRNEAFEDKPTEDPGEGYRWVWQERNKSWARVYFGTTGGGGGGGGGGGDGGGGGGGGGGGAPTQTYIAPDGRVFTDLASYNSYINQLEADKKLRAGQSAFDFLKDQFNRFGLGALIDDVSKYIKDGLSSEELLLRLRTESEAYKKRFAANEQRISKGLRALSEAEYILLEDQYQEVMRNYGLPESYYTRGDLGRQEGFEKFIAGDVSAPELEERIQTAQNRVINANPEVGNALRQFYPDITNSDILAYTLDPQKGLADIKRKVSAAEIGGAALAAGLITDVARAERLRSYGVTAEQAKQGYQAVSSVLPRATTLGDIYAKQGLGQYDQATAEAEVFGTPGSAEAAAKRRKLSELEQAQFGGSSGRAGGALARERAGQF